MRGFVWRAGGPPAFGMDGACETWANLPVETRRRALRYRRDALEFARRDAFTLPEEIKPATWRKWKQRAQALGFTLSRSRSEREFHPEPYTGTRWKT